MKKESDNQHCKKNLSLEVPTHPWLREIVGAPSRLFYEGDSTALFTPCFSIVGTRRPSSYGIQSALYFAKELAARGFTIVSGLARGIDGSAHRGALLAGGKTVAVLGHGLGRIYPPEHWELSQQIIDQGGCLVSEYERGTPPLKQNFPQRNRIISGLSVGTLIIEAAEKSGSLITARLALEQNREVFVIPSRFNEENFRGSHLLAQEGAKIVLNVEEILSEYEGLIPMNKELQKNDCEKFSSLQKAFAANDGVLSLSDLYLFPKKNQEKLLTQMQRAIEEKKVIETSPQVFFWVD